MVLYVGKYQICSKFHDFISKQNDGHGFIKQSLADGVTDITRKLSFCVRDIKTDIVDCNKLIKKLYLICYNIHIGA